MTQPEFERIDALAATMSGNILLVFANISDANAYCLHQHARGMRGIICRVEDTREGSGLVVQWRDPIKPEEFARCQGEALWMLEQVLAGGVPEPKRGKVTDISEETRTAVRRSKGKPDG